MHILSPHLSCVIDPLNPAEFEQAMAEGYSQIYVFSIEGLMLYRRINGGMPSNPRYVVSKVSALPKHAVSNLKPGINFLPDGKVPMSLFHSIVKFFSQVCEKFKTNLEAQIWVLWNQERGYYLHVPEQTVTAASVTYDWSQLPSDSILVVDFHSHGSMSAFFSGTDDNDDGGSIRYSGVIGRANTTSPEYVLRFNNQKEKTKCTLEDVFGHHVSVETHPEWLDRVTQRTYSTTPHPINKVGVPRGVGSYFGPTGQFSWDNEGDDRLGKSQSLANPGQAKKQQRLNRSNSRASGAVVNRSGANSRQEHLTSTEPEDLEYWESVRNLLNQDLGITPEVEAQLDHQLAASGFTSNFVPGPLDEPPVGGLGGLFGESEYNQNSAAYGREAAEAVANINESIVVLEATPELLSPLLLDGTKLLTRDARIEFAKDLLDSLPAADAASVIGK